MLMAGIIDPIIDLYILIRYGIVLKTTVQWQFLTMCDNVGNNITKERLADIITDIRTFFTGKYQGCWEDLEQDLLEMALRCVSSYKFDRHKPVMFLGYFYKSFGRRVVTELMNNSRRYDTTIISSIFNPPMFAVHNEGVCQEQKLPVLHVYEKLNIKYKILF